MNRVRTLPALALAAALLAPTLPVAHAGDDATPDLAAFLEAKAPSVVSVKFVLKMRLSMGGNTQDQEENAEVRGVLVDASGLVMLGNDALEGSAGMIRNMLRRRGGGGGADVSATPTDLKVLFGNDAKEHEAVLVARDSNLGLAFVQVLSMEGATATPVDLGAGAEPKVGQTLHGANRKSRGFDCAPVIERVLVSGRVEKPRAMWAVIGASGLGLPLYDAQSRVVGVLVHQEGSAGVEDSPAGFMSAIGGGDAGNFLLPLEAVRRVLEQAKKKVPDAVAKAKEAAAAAAAPATPAMDEPAMGEPAMGEPGMAEPGMGEPGMGEPGMGEPGMGADAPR